MSSFAAGASIQANLLRVPPGWVAPTSGYFFEEAALVEFATAAFTYEAENETWQSAYWELDGKYKKSLSDFERRLDVISEKHNEERAQWKLDLAKAKRRGHLPGIGFFAGAGYTGSGIEPVIGFGLVWKF
jgi:outer membrane receptor for monomeric catechols